MDDEWLDNADQRAIRSSRRIQVAIFRPLPRRQIPTKEQAAGPELPPFGVRKKRFAIRANFGTLPSVIHLRLFGKASLSVIYGGPIMVDPPFDPDGQLGLAV